MVEQKWAKFMTSPFEILDHSPLLEVSSQIAQLVLGQSPMEETVDWLWQKKCKIESLLKNANFLNGNFELIVYGSLQNGLLSSENSDLDMTILVDLDLDHAEVIKGIQEILSRESNFFDFQHLDLQSGSLL